MVTHDDSDAQGGARARASRGVRGETTQAQRTFNAQLAHATFRVYLGLNIALHGVVRLPKLDGFAQGLVAGFTETALPAWSVLAFAYVLVPAEVIVGLMVLVGVQLRGALVAGLGLMALLSFGTILLEQWDTAGLQVIYAMAYAGLLATLHLERWALWPSVRRTATG